MNHSPAATGATDSAVINIDWLRTRVSLIQAIAIHSHILTHTRVLSFSPSLHLFVLLFFVHGNAEQKQKHQFICASLLFVR